MILSLSRRTDIPAFFSEWAINRLYAGEAYVRTNPFNPKQITHYTFSPESVDCVVFWTKNPIPMLKSLENKQAAAVLDRYPYYFQFTLTGYGKDVEAGLPEKNRLIEAFKELSIRTDKNGVWRYDPIFFNSTYTMDWHLAQFKRISSELKGYTDRCVISFINLYSFVKKSLEGNKVAAQGQEDVNINKLMDFCRSLSSIARENGMNVYSCAEKINLDGVGILHGACIDKALVEKLCKYTIDTHKDAGQRQECHCVQSVDFGKYNTCGNQCRYCYATKKPSEIEDNLKLYNKKSPILCDTINKDDEIIEKKLTSFRAVAEGDDSYKQLTLF